MKNVLVIDDQETLRLLVCDILEDMDSSLGITQAEDGFVALEKLNSMDFGLVICDVKMPDMDGFEVIRRLRASTRNNQVPVLMLTAEGEPESIAQGVLSGATSYLTKPFNALELTEAVRPLLGAHT